MNDRIVIALNSLLQELDTILLEFNEKLIQLTTQKRLDEAQEILNEAKRITNLQQKIQSLQDEWFRPGPEIPRRRLKNQTEGRMPVGNGGQLFYTVDDHLKNKSEMLTKIFILLRKSIINLSEEDEIFEKAAKMYIAYSHGNNFCEVRPQQKELLIWLDINPSELDDPYKLARDVSNIGHYGTGDVEVRLSELSDVDKVMDLIEQSYLLTV